MTGVLIFLVALVVLASLAAGLARAADDKYTARLADALGGDQLINQTVDVQA